MSSKTVKVIVFGTFDHLHAGHENFFEQAKKLGTQLIVVVARDLTVKKIKSAFPELSENQRLKEIKKHPLVDKAILGDPSDRYKIIKKIRPHIIALGYDQFVFTYRLKKILIDAKLNTEIVRLKAYKPGIFKSSLLKES